jgi:hypothetical protein
LLSKLVRRGDLVVGARFPQIRPAGHYDNWSAHFEGCNDRPNPSVGYDELGRMNMIAKLRRAEELDNLNILRLVFGSADLCNDIGPATQSGPFIDAANQTIEGH